MPYSTDARYNRQATSGGVTKVPNAHNDKADSRGRDDGMGGQNRTSHTTVSNSKNKKESGGREYEGQDKLSYQKIERIGQNIRRMNDGKGKPYKRI